PARSMAAEIARAPRACAERPESAPWKTPMGVRTALKITTSSMTSPVERLWGNCRWPPVPPAGRAPDPSISPRPSRAVTMRADGPRHAFPGHRLRREADRAGDLGPRGPAGRAADHPGAPQRPFGPAADRRDRRA